MSVVDGVRIIDVELGEKLDGTPCVVVDLDQVKVRIPINTAARLASDIWTLVCAYRARSRFKL